MRQAGRHFLQVPGPSPVPDRILRAIDMPVIDHRGPGFAGLGNRVLGGIQGIFKTKQLVIIYPASGTGAWEAALVNTISGLASADFRFEEWGVDADQLRSVILEHCNTSLGNGLSKIPGKVFRIGHLGDINDVTLLGTLSGIEMGLYLAGVPHQSGGAQAALNYLKSSVKRPQKRHEPEST